MEAVDGNALLIRIEATQKRFERQLSRIEGGARKATVNIEKQFERMNRRLVSSTSSAASRITQGLGAIGVGLSIREVVNYGDAWTEAENKIKSAAQSQGVNVRSLEQLTDGANNARTELSAYADLYARLIRSASGVAKSETEIAMATNIVSKAFKAGGAAASEQASGILQLGQALGSGVLQGDELRSLRENAPLLAQAIANEFETTIAGLKQLGAEGELTSDRVFRAILNAQSDIETQFATTTSTIRDAITQISNEFTRYIGLGDDSVGASSRLVGALNFLAENFSETADSVAALAAILAGAFAGRAIVGVVIGLGRATTALGVFLTAVRAGTIANIAFTASLGPIGLLIGGATAAVILLNDAHNDAANAAQVHDAAIAELLQKLDLSASASEDARRAVLKEAEARLKASEAALTQAKAEAALQEQRSKEINDKGINFNGRQSSNNVFPTPFDDQSQSFDTAGLAKGISIAEEFAANDARTAAAREKVEKLQNDVNILRKKIAEGRESLTDGPKDTVGAGSTKGFGRSIGKSTISSGKKERRSPFERGVNDITNRTENLKAETALLSTLNPLVDNQTFALNRLRAERELINQAEASGLKVQGELKTQIEQLALGYAMAQQQAETFADSQENLRQRQEAFANFGREALGGFIQDLRNGVSATDALANALSRLTDRAFDIGLNAIFNGAGGGGGLLSGLTSIFPFANGGIAAKGKPLKTFARGGVSNTAAIFGEAGAEAAVPLPDGRSIPVSFTGRGNQSSGARITISNDNRGANPESISRLEKAMAELRRDIPMMVRSENRTLNLRGV